MPRYLISKINVYFKTKGKSFLLLTLVAVFFMTIASLIFYQLVDRQRIIMSAVEEDALWASYQLDRDILKLRSSLELLNIAYSEQQLESSRTLFDILYSRMNIIEKGQFKLLFQRQENGLETLQFIRSNMDEMDPVLFSENKPINTAFLLTKSRVLLDKSDDFVLGALGIRSKEKVENRNESKNILLSLGFSLIVLIIIVIFIIYILFKQLKTVNLSYEQSRKLTAELKAAVLCAEEASRVKSDFMATMSHEIRTPMNSILGFSHILLNDNLSGTHLDRVNKIHQSANSLLAIINGILDFSKIESGKEDIENLPFNIDQFLEYLYQLHADSAHQKGLDFQVMRDFSIAENLIGDKVKLQQICVNLIGNAIKFTPKGSVYVKLYPHEEDKIIIEVVDTGIGISQNINVFDVFQQGDTSTTRLYGGTGLGLSISQKITHLLKGNIRYESKENKGTQFFVSLPYQPDLTILKRTSTDVHILQHDLDMITIATNLAIPHVLIALNKIEEVDASILVSIHYLLSLSPIDELASCYLREKAIILSGTENSAINYQGLITPTSLEKVTSLTLKNNNKLPQQNTTEFINKKILIAEDNENNAVIVESIVSSIGFEVDWAKNGQEALEKATANIYDLILMDIRMPIMNGYDACEKINMALNNSVPIILITADILSEANIKKFADDVIFKPFAPQELINKVRATLLKAQQRQTRHTKDTVNNAMSEKVLSELLNNLALLEEKLAIGDSKSDSFLEELIGKYPDIIECSLIKKALSNIINYDYADALDNIKSFKAACSSGQYGSVK
jgi:signal transduction histidine kinase/FixJ family two-component response regulator